MLILVLIISVVFICILTYGINQYIDSWLDTIALMFALFGTFFIFMGSIIGLMR